VLPNSLFSELIFFLNISPPTACKPCPLGDANIKTPNA
jgi:hypothetical protein